MADHTYSLQPDVLQPGTLQLMRTTPDGCRAAIPYGWGLTAAQWRAVLATLPAEDGKSDAPAEDSIAAKLARVTAERDELQKIVQGYQDVRERLISNVELAANRARDSAKELRECAEAVERRADGLAWQAKTARALPIGPQNVAARAYAYRKAAAIAAEVRRYGPAWYTGSGWATFTKEELAAVDALLEEGAP
jgi:hypothetical protein